MSIEEAGPASTAPAPKPRSAWKSPISALSRKMGEWGEEWNTGQRQYYGGGAFDDTTPADPVKPATGDAGAVPTPPPGDAGGGPPPPPPEDTPAPPETTSPPSAPAPTGTALSPAPTSTALSPAPTPNKPPAMRSIDQMSRQDMDREMQQIEQLEAMSEMERLYSVLSKRKTELRQAMDNYDSAIDIGGDEANVTGNIPTNATGSMLPTRQENSEEDGRGGQTNDKEDKGKDKDKDKDKEYDKEVTYRGDSLLDDSHNILSGKMFSGKQWFSIN